MEKVGIVGGGPCGMMTALLLARHVGSIVFERKPGISTHPKAMGVSRRSAEIYRQIGLLGEIEKGALSGAGRELVIWSKSLVGEELGRVPQAEYRSPFTPCVAMHCPQTWVEHVLLEALKKEPLVEIRFDTEVTAAHEDGTLTLKSGETFTFPWIVAADGASSGVRHLLNVGTVGPGDMGHFINTMFHANYEPHLAERKAIMYNTLSDVYFEPFVAVDGRDTWLMHHFLQPGEKTEDFSKERLASIIKQASGLPDEPVEVLSLSPWVMSPKVADQFRVGRILFTGDAAARMSPAGGLGLNTGLQSAHNLAWKLALVMQGRAAERLLDTYHEERHNAALAVMQNTNRNAEEIMAIIQQGMAGNWDGVRDAIAHSRRGGSGLGQDLGVTYESGAFLPDGTTAAPVADRINDYIPEARPGARAPHVALENGSTLDEFGRDFCVLSASEAWPDASIIKEQEFLAAYGIDPTGAVLVRPDGYVAARWRTAPENPTDALKNALQKILF